MIEDQNSPALRAGVDFRGTKNATERVTEYVKPGKKRAPLLRYIRINLPRATRLVLLLVIAGMGVSSAAVALSGWEPFPFASVIQWAILGSSLAFVAVGLLTLRHIWAFGLGIAGTALLVYLGGIVGNAPYVWNGATIMEAAIWNLTLFTALGYFVLFWALRYGIIVAAPDDQNFMD